MWWLPGLELASREAVTPCRSLDRRDNTHRYGIFDVARKRLQIDVSGVVRISSEFQTRSILPNPDRDGRTGM